MFLKSLVRLPSWYLCSFLVSVSSGYVFCVFQMASCEIKSSATPSHTLFFFFYFVIRNQQTIYYLPLYFQVVKGETATQSGLDILPLLLGVVATNISAGFVVSKFGRYKELCSLGTGIAVVGFGLLYLWRKDTPTWELVIIQLVCGIGLGTTLTTLLLAAQSSVEVDE